MVKSVYRARVFKGGGSGGVDDFQQGVLVSDRPPVCIESRNSRSCNKVGPYGGEDPF